VVGAVVVAIGVVLAVVLTSRSGSGTGASDGGRTASGTTQGAPASGSAQTAGTSSPTTQASTRTSAQASAQTSSASGSGGGPVGNTVTAAEVRTFVTSYYSLLPDHPEQAYDLTGPTLRAAESRGNYIAFWHRFGEVRLGPVRASDGSLVAHGRVTYVEDGRTQPEQHTFTLVRGSDDRLLMDSDREG
jgi:hypothetical protein